MFVNHALTNPFFVPAKYGSHDAASLLGVTVEWTGSTSSDVGEMVKAMRRAIDTGADGIAVSIVDPEAFDRPTALALRRGIPVVSYNADGAKANSRLAYIGQDNYKSGLELGAHIVTLVERGDVYLFIATPRQQNIQPRIDGALDAIRDSGRPIRAHVVASGVEVGEERKRIEATYQANTKLRGLFAVDAGSTAGVAEVMRRHGLHARGVRAGGYDLLPTTLQAIHDRDLDFTIDQQPYLQGFLPVQQLFLDRYSSGLVVARGHEHRRQLHHARERRALPHDEESLRGQLEPRAVPGQIAPQTAFHHSPREGLHHSPRRVVLARSVAKWMRCWSYPWVCEAAAHPGDAGSAVSKCNGRRTKEAMRVKRLWREDDRDRRCVRDWSWSWSRPPVRRRARRRRPRASRCAG